MLPKHRHFWLTAALVILVLLVTAVLRWRRPVEPAPVPAGATPAPGMATPTAQTSGGSSAPAGQSVQQRLDGFAGQLAASPNAETSRRLLAELRAFLDTLPKDVASRDVQSWLGTGNDAATYLDVTIKPGGALGGASTVRVFLLDFLGQIDAPAAAALGRQVLSTPSSADEWAVSLRNVAAADQSAATLEFLKSKAAEMLANPAWRQNPSSGFLEAFDVIVHTRATTLAPQLTELVRDKGNKALAHAAYLTLDRLTITAPTETLQQLAANPELMAGREQTRANFFARADVRDPQQKALLEQYLLDASRTPQELQTFVGIYPNANFMISHNLLTPTPTPAQEQLTEHDRAALAVVEQWVADPRFEKLKPQMEAIRARLRTFVEQATASSAPAGER